jgi:ABC-type oligopeptide transport system substrate-binding subunit
MGCKVTVADACDGWYNPDAAKEFLAAAKEELGDTVSWPIQIDVVYLGSSANNTAQSQAYKQKVEETLGAENVVVNLIEATTTEDFYACGYRASNGEAGNFDMFYGSGWGPDYGDPNTYLNTFLGGGAGYMTKVIGLY